MNIVSAIPSTVLTTPIEDLFVAPDTVTFMVLAATRHYIAALYLYTTSPLLFSKLNMPHYLIK